MNGRFDLLARRLGWALLSAFGVSVLGVARFLTPSPSGVGTHQQLGLPPCGFLVWLDWPCPACGLTTAFARTARLQWGPAFRAHPLGPLLFGLVIGLVLLGVRAAVRGDGLVAFVERYRADRIAELVALGLLLCWLLRSSARWIGAFTF